MKTFGHTRPVRDEAGNIIGSADSPVKAKTISVLSPAFGTDRNKRLVVSLERGDQIVIRPERTSRTVQVAAVDVYSWLLRKTANLAVLENARKKKESKQQRLAAQRQKRAEKRFFGNVNGILTKAIGHPPVNR